MAIYSELSHEKWWFSIAFCMFTRGYTSCAKHCQSHLIIVHVVRRTIRISTSNGKITRSHIGASGSFKSSQRCRISYIYMIIYDYIWLYMIIYDYIWLYMYNICLLMYTYDMQFCDVELFRMILLEPSRFCSWINRLFFTDGPWALFKQWSFHIYWISMGRSLFDSITFHIFPFRYWISNNDL